MAWDDIFDVVVIGSGIAGVSTALAARAIGLRPVLLEKAEKLGGGTAFSMGGLWIGNNHLALAAGYRDSRADVLDYMRFVAAEEADDERLVAYADRGPEALKFFEDCGIRFRISRGLTDHYFGVAPGSLAEGRCLNTEFIAATELGDWQDAILVPRDTPIEVNSEELFKWGGIANIDNWPKDVLEDRRRRKIRTRGVGVITHFVKQLLASEVAIRPGTHVERLIVEADRVAGVVTEQGSADCRNQGHHARLRRLSSRTQPWRRPTRVCPAGFRCSRRRSRATASSWRRKSAPRPAPSTTTWRCSWDSISRAGMPARRRCSGSSASAKCSARIPWWSIRTGGGLRMKRISRPWCRVSANTT